MAMVECKECGGQISQNAETCPHCGDVIKEPKPKFSLVDLIHRISVPVVLSVAGTLITVLSYFSMEGERQMEQTRKLLSANDPERLDDRCRQCNQRQRPVRCPSNDAGPARAKVLSTRAQTSPCPEHFQPYPNLTEVEVECSKLQRPPTYDFG